VTASHGGNVSWTGVSINAGAGIGIDFTGTTHQKLFLYNTVVYSSSTDASIRMTNTGLAAGRPSEISGWDILVRNFDATDTCVGLKVAQGIVNAVRWEITANSAAGTSIAFTAPSAAGTRVSHSGGELVGRVEMGGTGASFSSVQSSIDAGTNPIVDANGSALVTLGQVFVKSQTLVGNVVRDLGAGPVYFSQIGFGNYSQYMPAASTPLDGTQQGGYFKAAGDLSNLAAGRCFADQGFFDNCAKPGPAANVVPAGHAVEIVAKKEFAGVDHSFTVYQNGAPTALTCSTGTTSTWCSIKLPVPFLAGDLLGVSAGGATPTEFFTVTVRYVNR
jgi:hypothetical protein